MIEVRCNLTCEQRQMNTLRKSTTSIQFWERGHLMFVLKSALPMIGAVLLVPHVLIAQHANANDQKEQSEFGIELEVNPILRPVELTRAALDALSKDKRVLFCLKKNGLSPEELPANWFIASEIHLNGPNEKDLVVLPSGRLPNTPAGEISQNACLVGANAAQMLVLRKNQNGFQLVLSQIGLGMGVLSTRTNRLRDIQLVAAVGGYTDSIDYEFDGQFYVMTGRSSALTGAELPHTLAGYENRKQFIQSPRQSSEDVRAQARAWVWLQWETHKSSYLRLKTHDSKGDETCSFFLAPTSSGEWQVTIQVRRTVRDKHAATLLQRRIAEYDLSVATEVQRVEPTQYDLHLPRIISGNEDLPESKYRLQFLDYAQRTVLIL
jgi:hypothetical protein